MNRWRILGVALTALLAASPALGGTTRVAFAVDEVGLDGARSASDLEGAMIERLTGTVPGLSFVYLDRTASVRAAAAGPLTAQGRARLVEAADADLLVLGEVRLSKADSGYLPGAQTVEAAARLEVVATDSGEVLRALRAQGVGSHYGVRAAEAKAVESLVKKLGPKLVSALEIRRRFALTLTLPESVGTSEVDAVVACLVDSEGFSGLEVQALQPGEARLLISGEDPRELSRRLDGRCGLRTRGYTARAVQLELRPGGLGRLPVFGQAFTRDPGLKGYRWLAAALPRMVLAELAAEPYLDVKLDRLVKTPPSGALLVRGRYAARSKGLWVSMQLVGPDAQVWRAEQRVCQKSESEACFVAAAHALASGARAAVDARRGGLKPVTVGRETTPVRIAEVHVDPIFPARRGAYDARQPVGWVELENVGNKPLKDLVVTAELGGLSARPSESRLEVLAPGTRARVPLSLWLEVAKIRDLRQPRTIPVSLAVRGPGTAVATRSTAAVVYAKNAVDWPRAPESAAAFVDPSDPAVRTIAAAFRAAAPKDGFDHPLGSPALAYQALAGLTYTPDAAQPFAADAIDSVRFPSETWVAGGG